jgi:hypothetical protein
MPKTKPKLYKNRYFVSSIILAALIILVAVLELTNTTHIFHKPKVPPVIPSHSSSAGQSSKVSSSSPTSAGTNQDTSVAATGGGETADHDLVAPTGNFVSNHFPGANGSPTTEASTCNTSPGASCYIKFTNIDTGQTTQLSTQAVDARGSTSWYWDVSKDAHLTSGQWKVAAVASLGSQTKSSDDALKLTVQ